MGKKMGRPKVYDNEEGRRGAPKLTVRLASDVYEHIERQPEGPRPYLERVVREDRERATNCSGEDGAELR